MGRDSTLSSRTLEQGRDPASPGPAVTTPPSLCLLRCSVSIITLPLLGGRKDPMVRWGKGQEMGALDLWTKGAMMAHSWCPMCEPVAPAREAGPSLEVHSREEKGPACYP